MQQTQTAGKAPSDKLSWLDNKYRQGIFDLLAQLTDAKITVVEGSQRVELGNIESELAGELRINDSSVYSDFVTGGSLGAAQAYIDKKWDSPDLTKLIQVFARSQKLVDELERNSSILNKLQKKLLSFSNRNTQEGSKRNILAHYDLGNELYTRFLDEKMMYSCAYYDGDISLSEAQQAKLKLICDKLDLKPSDHLVEIGTGWGGLAIYAAQNYGCKVTTTTISDAQHAYAREKIAAQGLSKQITLLKKDYRELEGEYDKLVSIEMIEAVGHEFLGQFFNKCSSLLKPDGKMLLQAITIADQRYDTYRKSVDFINKYIFPGGCLPSMAVMSQHIADTTDMMIDNVQDIGLHYARTLFDWRHKFDENWADITEFGYDDTFKRLWHYYLCYCEGAFIERVISTHHIVARKPQYKDNHDATVLDY
ncbi:cyclopropane-fatty-acyl-phospholipid synthase family protein [Psychrobium sp. MM17-31]|uniref:SAM-dependent methyltransferase n=1 Tax=Psychrobium sp. MM17-31 TaxID=2917758 RepID=UPI001EF4D562|nr:cyclopropane-fatty-acyl-phospholipid synthase family protein [Psychrobium sp. MM17-31]MCG7531384.1 cyclopropane-fatty-acyl-phospholipid synthase family protein [Psychrobium sp. MM17-31]